tara:strand:- start:162 stop:878 length:717 start_codon:yes stop_codon:yes gene_type:complete
MFLIALVIYSVVSPTLTFEDIECPESNPFYSYAEVPQNYHGFSVMDHLGSTLIYTNPQYLGGWTYISDNPETNTAFLSLEFGIFDLTRSVEWDLHSFRANNCWQEWSNLTLYGLTEYDVPLYHEYISLEATNTPVFIELNWTGVRKVRMFCDGGYPGDYPDHPGGQCDFVIDDLHYSGSTCPADVDHNWKVDTNDILLVISSWGSADTTSAEDINNDGVVDIDDLLEIIPAWGHCGES